MAGMSSLGRSGRCIHTAETRPTGRSHGKSRRVSQKTDPRKTERAAETDRPLGFRLWETAMGNRSRNPMGNRGLVSALSRNAKIRRVYRSITHAACAAAPAEHENFRTTVTRTCMWHTWHMRLFTLTASAAATSTASYACSFAATAASACATAPFSA